MSLKVWLAIGLASVGFSFQDSDHLCNGFLPKNDMKIPVGSGKDKGGKVGMLSTTQSEFNTAIDKVANVYTPIFRSKGVQVSFKKMWEKADVNAVAYIQNGVRVVEIWGGLGRHQSVTADAISLITCHEVGHHLGGAPKYSGGSDKNWASVEGQSDYFATSKCLRKVFAADIDSWNGTVDSIPRSKCENSFGINTKESKICGRIAMASLSAATVSGGGSFASRDTSVVRTTNESHPRGQCRLDTYVNGDICKVADTVDFSNSNTDAGACRNIAEENYGARPLCWFKPPAAPSPNPNPDPNPPPPPPPVGETATPNINGVQEFTLRNPNQVITFNYDVSNIPGAAGAYFEVIGPNMDFSVPNGTQPDPRAMPGGSFPGTKRTIQVLPARQLPGWGVYKFRVIPLDRTGRNAIGKFSNPATLKLQP